MQWSTAQWSTVHCNTVQNSTVLHTKNDKLCSPPQRLSAYGNWWKSLSICTAVFNFCTHCTVLNCTGCSIALNLKFFCFLMCPHLFPHTNDNMQELIELTPNHSSGKAPMYVSLRMYLRIVRWYKTDMGKWMLKHYDNIHNVHNVSECDRRVLEQLGVHRILQFPTVGLNLGVSIPCNWTDGIQAS